MMGKLLFSPSTTPYFLNALPSGLCGLNANVVVFHLLLDPTGLIRSNQLCARVLGRFPLLVIDAEKITDIYCFVYATLLFLFSA